jgi:hypothetical protein
MKPFRVIGAGQAPHPSRTWEVRWHPPAGRRLRDRSAEGVHLGNLGLAYAALGENRRAIQHHEQALVISREIGDRQGEGDAFRI